MDKRNFFIGLVIAGFVLILVIGVGVWLGPDSISQILTGISEASEPADIENPLMIENKHFSLEYPGNWKIDKADPFYKADKHFKIKAPGLGNIDVTIVASRFAVDVITEHIVRSRRELLRNIEESSFELWGNYKGYGRKFSGIQGLSKRCIRCFGIPNSKGTVVIVEDRFDDHEENNKPGYDLIARTFKFIND